MNAAFKLNLTSPRNESLGTYVLPEPYSENDSKLRIAINLHLSDMNSEFSKKLSALSEVSYESLVYHVKLNPILAHKDVNGWSAKGYFLGKKETDSINAENYHIIVNLLDKHLKTFEE